MSAVQEMGSAIARLNQAQREAMRDWLDKLVEEKMEVGDAFKGKVTGAPQAIVRRDVSRGRPPKAARPRARPGTFTRAIPMQIS